MEETSKEKIKQLKAEGKYDEIYYQFGAKEYRKNTPYRIKKEEIEDLYYESKYFDIYNKYGEKKYNKYLAKAMFHEIYDDKGFFSAYLWSFKRVFKNVMAGIVGTVLIAPPAIGVIGAEYSKEEAEKNSITYQEEIKAYNEKIEKYAKEVNSMNLSDVQIYMKVMRDMWAGIQGYADPDKDITGYWELDLATQDGYGVCRNMAVDVAQKLNAINPKYNARTMSVQVGDDGKYQNADIKTKHANVNEQENNDVSNEQITIADLLAYSIAGNHLITLVDSPEDNLVLILDPTNPGIGIFKDAKITMFNSDKVDKLEVKPKLFMTPSFSKKAGIEGVKEMIEDCAKSYAKPKLKKNQIEEKYGLEAQNQALKEVEKIEIMKACDFWKTIEVDTSSKKEYNPKIEKKKEEIIVKRENER